MRRLLLGLAFAAVCGQADAATQTVTLPCTKDLASGEYSYDTSGWPAGYRIAMVSFRESRRDGRAAYGSCTITLRS